MENNSNNNVDIITNGNENINDEIQLDDHSETSTINLSSNDNVNVQTNVDSFWKKIRKRKLTDEKNNNMDIEIKQLFKRYRKVSRDFKSPFQLVQELFHKDNKKISISFEIGNNIPHEPIYIASINIPDFGIFIGKGRSKQMSKQYAAENFLEFLNYHANPKKGNEHNKKLKINNLNNDAINDNDNNLTNVDVKPSLKIESNQVMMLDDKLLTQIIDTMNKKIFDIINPVNLNYCIENTISNKAEQKSFKNMDLWRYKEYSAFILESTLDNTLKVISIGTGCKCVKSEYQLIDGTVIRDCHAEIIARRSLICFFYEQLELLFENNLIDKPEFIIEPVNKYERYFRLKKHFKLHLFISSPPCGDGRIYNFNDKMQTNSKIPKGVLRVKIENGQGTVPMPKDYLSTWDGIMMSEQRSTTMSCSDKISLWNVVGIQGSLLSHLMEPVYIESLVVANLFNYENLIRSSYGRIDKNIFYSSKPISKFKINEHKVGGCTNNYSSKTKDSINISHNWFDSITNPNNNLEIVRTETGKNRLNDQPSRLCKKNLMKKFLNIVEKYPDIQVLINADDNYHDLKYRAIEYHKFKLALFTTLKQSQLGTWIKAPNEYDLFSILD